MPLVWLVMGGAHTLSVIGEVSPSTDLYRIGAWDSLLGLPSFWLIRPPNPHTSISYPPLNVVSFMLS